MRTIAPHGNRTRYIHHKCRCEPCKEANNRYTAQRRAAKPHPNRLVPVQVTRRHLRMLRRRSVGLRSVSAVTGLSPSRIKEIRSGGATRVTLSTERRILSVTADAYAGGARVPVARTLRLVKRLQREGFTNERLALQLGLWPETLQRLPRRKRVTADTQMRVEKLYNIVMAEAA